MKTEWRRLFYLHRRTHRRRRQTVNHQKPKLEETFSYSVNTKHVRSILTFHISDPLTAPYAVVPSGWVHRKTLNFGFQFRASLVITSYCYRRLIALSQLTTSSIQIVLAFMVWLPKSTSRCPSECSKRWLMLVWDKTHDLYTLRCTQPLTLWPFTLPWPEIGLANTLTRSLMNIS